MLEDLDLDSIADEQARECVRRLLNLLEDVRTDLRAAQAEIQRLRNEINRLKGEQGQPTIKPNTPQPPPKDLSSEQERRKPKAWSKGRKTDRIPIDREQVVAVDPARLPPDAVFKGYEDVVVQDVIFRTDNVLFRKEKFHIPPNLVVECVTAYRKPPDVRICRLRNQSRVGTVPPSTSTPHCPAC